MLLGKQRNKQERGCFIKTLSIFCYLKCAEVLSSKREQNQYFIKTKFIQIERVTHPLPQTEKDELFNLPNLNNILFEGSFNPESKKVEYLTIE